MFKEDFGSCIACGGAADRWDQAGWAEPLCADCETAYLFYVIDYKPRKVKPASEGSSQTLSEPATRHQWAAHQRRKGA